MQELYSLLLALDCLYSSETLAEYEQARQVAEAQIKKVLPGFTVGYALEVGTIGAGNETYQHGGVAHVLLPIQEREKYVR